MKRAYSFITDMDLGLLGMQTVDVSYSYDPKIHVLNLMTVHLVERGNLGAEITDYLNADGENQLYEEMSRDCAKKRKEEAEEAEAEAAERHRERMQEAIWEIEQ